MRRIIVLFYILFLTTSLTAQNFSANYTAQSHPGVATQIHNYQSIWKDLKEKICFNGFLNILISESINILEENDSYFIFTERANTTIKYKIEISGGGSQYYIQIGSISGKSCSMPYRAEVICLPGNGSIYAIISEMYFGSVLEKYKIDETGCSFVEMPLNLLCQINQTDIGSQILYYAKDINSPIIGQIAEGAEVEIIGMKDYEKKNSSFKAWLFVKTKSGLSGWVNYYIKWASTAG